MTKTKKRNFRSKSLPRKSIYSRNLVIVFFTIIALLIVAKSYKSALQKGQYLGAMYLAKDGESGGDSRGGGHEGSGGSGDNRNNNSSPSQPQSSVGSNTNTQLTPQQQTSESHPSEDNSGKANTKILVPKSPKPTEAENEVENRVENEQENTKSKVKVEIEDDKVKIKKENGNGIETEIKDVEKNKIEQELKKEQEIELEATGEGELALVRGGFTTQTTLPISVDSKTHKLFVTTPKGTKEVAVLPDQAVENILRNKLLDQIEGGTQKLILDDKTDLPEFEVRGVKQKRILGLFPISIAKKLEVDTETGEILETNTSLIDRIFEAISF